MTSWFFEDDEFSSGSSDEVDFHDAATAVRLKHSSAVTGRARRNDRRRPPRTEGESEMRAVAALSPRDESTGDTPTPIFTGADPNTTKRDATPLIHVPRRYLIGTGNNNTVRAKLLNFANGRGFNFRRARVHELHVSAGSDDTTPRSTESSDSGTGATGVFICRFDTAAAFQTAFQLRITQPLTGEFVVPDVLLSILLWVPVDQTTLLAVSRVSRAWREAAENLPQWSVVPQLLHPNATLVKYANVSEEQFYGTHVASRSEYLATMQTRSTARENAKNAYLPSACCIKLRLHALMQYVAVSAATLGVLWINFVIGTRAVASGALDSDVKIGFLCSFLSILFLPWFVIGIQVWTRNLMTPVTSHLRNLRRRGDYGYMFASITVVITLSTVFGLLGARVGQAAELAGRVARYTEDGCPTNVTDTPAYVYLAAPGNWSLEAPSAPCPSTVASSSWAKAYLESRNMSQWTCVEQFLANNTSSRYVLLAPPPSWTGPSCRGTRVAMLFDSQSTAFNSTIRDVFFAPNASASPAYFRTPTSSLFLQLPAEQTQIGDAWYSGGANNNASSPWALSRVALFVAPTSRSPDGLTRYWLNDALFWTGLSAVYLFGVFVMVALPRKCLDRERCNFLYGLAMWVCLNPLMLVGFGIKCTWFPDDDTCLMSHTSAVGLFWSGIAMVVLIVGAILP